MSALALPVVLALSACTSPVEPGATDGTLGVQADALRPLRPEEYVGFLQLGEEQPVAYAASPTYRALRYRVNAFDRVIVTVTSDEPNTAPLVTILGPTGLPIATTQTNGSPLTLSYKAGPTFAQHTVVVREASLATTTFHVRVDSTGVHEPAAFVPDEALGAYQIPPALAGTDTDVAMKCLQRQYAFGGTFTEMPVTGVLSLRWIATPARTISVLGGDGALSGAGGSYYGLTEQPDSLFLTRSTGDLLITNQAAGARIEFALSEPFGNGPGPARELSCVGVTF